jgi:hypothetical protein
MSTTDNTYDWQEMVSIMAHARDAIRTTDGVLRRAWHLSDDEDEMEAISAKRELRYWIIREMDKYPMHPVIDASIKLVRPIDWQQLLLEWPHISEGDRTRIAYTQNEAKGQKNVQTVTSVGKYLNRHFDLPDHTIRDLVARHGSAARFQFVHTTAEMIYHLHRGPGSCMVWREDRGIRCSDSVNRHPYEAYDPKYGWHMAVRIEGDETIGRALCMTSPTDDKKYYVRTYARPSSNGGYSETDNGMENWLTEQGYHKRDCWRDGERLAYHETCDHFLAPFLDGGEKRVTIDAGAKAIVVDNDGEYVCDQTGGCPTDDSGDFFDCEDCGDRTDDDDGYWVGRSEDTRVCESCLEHNYVYVYGRRGHQYHVHQDNAVYVESQSEHYDEDYLDDNEIIELNNGEYAPLDEAVEINGDWFHVDDDRICRTEDTDEFLLVDDGCWQCTESGNWYTDSVDYVEANGDKYHPDYAPKQADDDEDEDGDTAVAVAPVVTKPEATMLTMDMLSEVALVEDYTIAGSFVRFGMTILHDGVKLFAHRDVPAYQILQHTMEQTRIDMRKILSTELMHMASINAQLTLETQGE